MGGGGGGGRERNEYYITEGDCDHLLVNKNKNKYLLTLEASFNFSIPLESFSLQKLLEIKLTWDPLPFSTVTKDE